MATNTDTMRRARAVIPKQPGSQYTDEQRREAISHYVLLGNIRKVSELTNIPKTTLREWRKSEWWAQQIVEIRLLKQDEVDARITNIMDNVLSNVERRFVEGEQYGTDKDGSPLYKPVSARDSTIVYGTLFDKRQIMRNLPTSISANTDSQALAKLRADFEALASREELVIEGESVS